MKLRSDFVTNSSSSSFIVINAESKTLSDILKKFADELYEEATKILDEICEEKVSLSAEDCIGAPQKLSEIVPVLAQIFCYEVYIPNSYDDEDEDQEAKEEFEEILEDDSYGIGPKVAKEIIENRSAIENDLKSFYGEFSDYSYGGDSDALYYRENYDPDYLNEILEKIAKENNCTITDIDNDAFIRYVGKFIGEDKTSVEYSKENDKFDVSRTFTLNSF